MDSLKERGAEGKGVTWNTPTKAPSCIFSVAPWDRRYLVARECVSRASGARTQTEKFSRVGSTHSISASMSKSWIFVSVGKSILSM